MPRRRTEAVARAVRLIEAHLDEPLPIDRVAQAGYLSPFHFQRLFFQSTGESVAGYIRRRRLERGAHLLIERPNESLIQIALACGFQTHSAFSRAFRQHFGQTPSAFQNGGGDAILAASGDARPFLRPFGRPDFEMDMDILPMPALWLQLRAQPGLKDGVFFADQVALGEGFAALRDVAGPSLLSLCGAFEGGPKGFSDPEAVGWYGGVFTAQPSDGWSDTIVELPPMRWATFAHYGSFQHLHLTWNKACRNWLPAHDLGIASGWLFETYLQPANAIDDNRISAQIYVPLDTSARSEQQS